MVLQEYINSLLNYKGFAGDIVCRRTLPAVPARFAPKESDQHGFNCDRGLSLVLHCLGIDRLYTHQLEAIRLIRQGRHTVISTPTASGKSLVYNIPVIDRLIRDPAGCALYLFPLKALARDQFGTVNTLLKAVNHEFGRISSHGSPVSAAVYDGDLSSYQKTRIRSQIPNILLTNPEMLHLSMLAHHALWKDFFKNLQFVVIDEVHTYRGVMGSNMAWVFRRLTRICELYGASPVFVFCSATIANPVGLTQMLTGLDVELVDRSTAPAGKKDVILMRGRDGAARTAIALIHSAVHRELRTIVYTQSRKITELIALWSAQRAGALSAKISAYRAGFLPEERREIERQLASGDLLAVVSTSALELGIDIGNLDICILVGYPGTIMSTWQRAGRVGRQGDDSLLVLIAHEDALDQYFVNHPDQFFSMPPETAIINPENDIILKNHLECAAAESAVSIREPLLDNTAVARAMTELESEGRVLRSENGELWYAARRSPHRHVNLRGSSRGFPIFIADTQQLIGEMDRHRAFFEAHEGAVYLHRGDSYVITGFDHEKGIIEARLKQVTYFTRARSTKSTHILEQIESRQVFGTRIGFGRLKILEQVTGYEKKQTASQKSLGIVPLDLPVIEFETQGLWIEIPDRVREYVDTRQLHFMGGIHAVEHAAIGILPLLVMTDRNDLGGISIPFHPQTGKAAVFIYDGVPGGLGLSRAAYGNGEQFLEKTLALVSDCACDNGCPVCVHSPKCGSGNRPLDKAACRIILSMIVNDGQLDPDGSCPAVAGIKEDIHPYGTADTKPDDDNRPDRGLPRFAVLDIETRKSAQDVGGWHNAHKMQVSCAVLYDSREDAYRTYLQDDIDRLVADLQAVDLVVGFNISRFDYRVLSGLSDFDFHSLPTLDILTVVHRQLGFRLSLDHLAKETLGAAKSADGLQALEWYRQGEMDKIIEYCTQDVRVTKDLYLYGAENHFLLFRNKAGQKVRVRTGW